MSGMNNVAAKYDEVADLKKRILEAQITYYGFPEKHLKKNAELESWQKQLKEKGKKNSN